MSELTPQTRNEIFMSAIASGNTDVPEPMTRNEKFLYAILNTPSTAAAIAAEAARVAASHNYAISMSGHELVIEPPTENP